MKKKTNKQQSKEKMSEKKQQNKQKCFFGWINSKKQRIYFSMKCNLKSLVFQFLIHRFSTFNEI